MIDLEDFLKDLRFTLENLESKYQTRINHISSNLSMPYEINKNIYEESCQFFSKIFIDLINSKYITKKFSESVEKYRLITENANDLITVQNDKFEFEYI
ncbi:MAG: hypothetical protein ACFFG0_11840, partial [Candidatus Thorarchaeota archaeon]